MLRKIMNGSYALLALVFAAGLIMSCGGGAGGGSNTGNSTYTLSGTVSGAVPQGVTITLSGAGAGTTTTSAGGAYSFTGLSNGYYTVTATRANYKFTPASQVVPVNYANAAAANIVSENAYSVSGTVADGAAAPTAGVTMTLTGSGIASSLTATTNASASSNYTFNGLSTGDYTVTPGKNSYYDAGLHTLTTYSFSPANQPVTITNANLPSVNFVTTATTTNAYGVSGKIISGSKSLTTAPFILEGVSLSLIQLNASQPFILITTSDATGNYAFNGVPNGDYEVVPTTFHTGSCPFPIYYDFSSPGYQLVTVNGANSTVADIIENVSRGSCAIPL